MAGMLPGVESARRRRLHGSSGWCDSPSAIGSGFGSARIRVSHDTHLTPTSLLQTSMVNQSDDDEKLGGAAKEAKQRLHGRLRGHLKKEITRQNNQERLKKSGLKRLSWVKMGLIWKASNQDECAICLDRFKSSEKVIYLPCTHRFHSDCVLPWLESSAHCPCCRKTIIGSN